MKTLTTILTVLTLVGGSFAPLACAESTDEVVLIGRGDLLSQNVPGRRHVTRIERYVQSDPMPIGEPTLAALDDQQAPLLEAMPSTQPVLEHLVVQPRQSDPRQAVLGSLSQSTGPYGTEEIPGSIIAMKFRSESVACSTVIIVSLLMIALALRRWILAAVSRAVLWLVVLVNHRGATIVSKSHRRRRSRSSSRRRSPDVSWYFRKASESSGNRSRSRSRSQSSSRRRWSSTATRPRDYVVTDVVYATAPVQPAPRYLLTNSLN
ncbi:MAG: hypothetical protein K8T91_10335 [Planctomycetes bacterium]|nr:hypothetical protein [Planctomycetota bacterium]